MKKKRSCLATIAMGVILLIVLFFVLTTCHSKKAEKEKMKEYNGFRWPDSALAKMLPNPEVEKGKIDSETENNLSVDVLGLSKEQFASYIERCEENGFTVDYSKTDSSYHAKDDKGYALTLHYYDKQHPTPSYVSISLRAPEKEEILSGSKSDTNEQKPAEETSEKNSKEDAPAQESGVVNPEFKASMDSYEAFFDEYIALIKKYNDNPTDIALLQQYTEMITKYTEMMAKYDAIDEASLSEADLRYYNEVNLRITEKLTTVQ